MELSRLSRALRDRWISVLVLTLLGLVAGIAFTVLANENREPVYQATAPIGFTVEEGQSTDDLADQLNDAQAAATVAAQDMLLEDPSLLIQTDTFGAKLLFIAQASSPEEAAERARSLRQAYLEIDPLAGGASVDDQIAQIEAEAAELQAQLDALQPGVTLEQQELIERHDFLDAQITQLNQRLVQLSVEYVTATDTERVLIDEQRQQIAEALVALNGEKDALPPRPDEQTADIATSLRRNALQRRLDLLALEHERLYLRKLGVTSGGQAEPVVLADLTPPPTNALVAGGVGMLAATVLALGALIFDSRTRRPVWIFEDVPIPVLEEVPPRRGATSPDGVWYDRVVQHPRKEAVQSLRTAIEGRLTARPSTLGFADDRAGSTAVHALAADLAASFASSGWSVLLVDADFVQPGSLPEYHVAGSSLADLLSIRSDDLDAARRHIEQMLDDATVVRPDLAVVPAGQLAGDPADALAGRHLRTFLDEALHRFDLVIGVGGDVDASATQALLQRLDATVLCLAPGRSTMPRTEALVAELSQRRISVLGATLLSRSGASGSKRERVVTGGARPSPGDEGGATPAPPSPPGPRISQDHQPAQPAEPVSRSGSNDRPEGETRVRVLTAAELEGWVAEDQPEEEVLDRLSRGELAGYAGVAAFLVGESERLFAATAGDESIGEETRATLNRLGFLPLQSIRGIPSVGAHLAAEWRRRLGSRAGNQVERTIREVLEKELGESLSVDDWLALHFFAFHVQRTDREPFVWHLTSEAGTVQVLAQARRLTRERLDLLDSEVVKTVIDSLERSLKAATRQGKSDLVGQLEVQLADARTFEVALGWLYEGSHDNARITYPWKKPEQQPRGWNPVWSEGVKPNIAPLQRLGLLPVPVLTDEELYSLRPTG